MHTDANNSTQQVAITNSSCREERTFIYHPFESPLRNSGHTLSSTRRPGEGSGRQFAPLVKHLILLRGMSKRLLRLAPAVTSAKSGPSELGARERTMPRKQTSNTDDEVQIEEYLEEIDPDSTTRLPRSRKYSFTPVHYVRNMTVNEETARRRSGNAARSLRSLRSQGVVLCVRARSSYNIPTPLESSERSERVGVTPLPYVENPVHCHGTDIVNGGERDE